MSKKLPKCEIMNKKDKKKKGKYASADRQIKSGLFY